MTSHTRLSPGYEFQEIDRSQYADQPDGSVTDTAVWMAGFADRGPDYQTTWVNSMQTFLERYGAPTNELEKYLYNGAEEIIGRGGRCLVSKLPYDNDSKDKFAYTRYTVSGLVSDGSDEVLAGLSAADHSISSYLAIGEDDAGALAPLMSMTELDDRIVNRRSPIDNAIEIVNVSRSRLGKMDLTLSSDGTEINGADCLGLFPVLVGAANAAFYQGVISSQTSSISGYEFTAGLSAFCPVSDVRVPDRDKQEYSVSFGSLRTECLAIPVSADTVWDDSVSYRAVSQFPRIGYARHDSLEREYLKKIGLVVFEARRAEGNGFAVDFVPVEAYVGSLDRNAKSDTGASEYLGDVVNSQSRLVRFFSNVRSGADDDLGKACAISIPGLTARVLGFSSVECEKKVSYSGSIANSLNKALPRVEDPNKVRVDIVCDCGLANVAMWLKRFGEDRLDASWYPFGPGGDAWDFAKDDISAWRAVADKLDAFAKTRKDCLFVSDGPRPLVLKGDEKTVRLTDPESSIERDIVPNLRYVQGLNSNRSCGYLNWYLVGDAYSGDRFWCPPSVKAAGVMVYTDAYHHTWDAPAGLNRGGVRGALDVSFDPHGDEAGRIYEQAWNYAVSYPLEGIVVEGQKTFQRTKTALDRINVRRLMLWLERRVAAKARRFLYEGNTAYLR